MTIIANPYERYPTGWSRFSGNHLQYNAPPMFPNATATYRFGARFRAAKAFRGATLDGYADAATARGYSALLGMVLAFSAFEYFHKQVLVIDVPALENLLWSEHGGDMTNYQQIFEHFVQSHESDLLLRGIRPHVNQTHQNSIDEVLSGGPPNLIRIIAVIRHAFVHGHLTPNMQGVPPATVIELCEFATDFAIARSP